MRLRSFTATSLSEAMSRVRETLGPDAVILSNQPADDGKGVRVTAALEDSPLEDLTFDSPFGTSVSIDEIGEALAYHRVPPGLFDRLVGAAAALPAEDEILALGAALDNEFDFAALPEAPTPRPLILVGPPGAGKTATAAKLCARVRLAGGEASLITMDTAKSGGLAQIAAFAEALGARLEPAPDIDALATAVAACPKDRFVAIDTVGANPFDAENMGRLALAARAADADAIAILPAGGDVADCAEAAVVFAEIGARHLIVTRIDAARRFGGFLSAAQAGGLALMAAGASPRISDGLLPFNPVSLARLLLPACVRFGETAFARGNG
jgi:flagellar biosynthesis protein FlhF